MRTNNTNTKEYLIYPELSYQITGILFRIHNSLGRFCKERVYADALAKSLTEAGISFVREPLIRPTIQGDNLGDYRPDFVIGDSVIIELKARPIVTKEDYAQLLQYLRFTNKRLGLLVNFRNKFLKPKRIAN